MSTQKFMREIGATLEEFRMPVLEVTISKHIKYRVQTPFGPRVLICSVSPSGRHAIDMVRRQIRHLYARGAV